MRQKPIATGQEHLLREAFRPQHQRCRSVVIEPMEEPGHRQGLGVSKSTARHDSDLSRNSETSDFYCAARTSADCFALPGFPSAARARRPSKLKPPAPKAIN